LATIYRDFANDTCVKIAEILISLQLTAKATNRSRETARKSKAFVADARTVAIDGSDEV